MAHPTDHECPYCTARPTRDPDFLNHMRHITRNIANGPVIDLYALTDEEFAAWVHHQRNRTPEEREAATERGETIRLAGLPRDRWDIVMWGMGPDTGGDDA